MLSLTDRVTPDGAASSSKMVTLAPVTVASDRVPVSAAEPGCSFQLLTVGVSVKLKSADGASAGMVMLKLVGAVNLTRPSALCPASETATVWSVPKLVPPPTVAVTAMLRAPPFSVIDVGFTLRATLVGVASSSVSVMSAVLMAVMLSPLMLPATVTTLGCSSTLSSSGVSVNIPVADCAPAGMLMVIGLTAAMSTRLMPAASAIGVAVTVTALATPKRVPPSTVAVTVTVVAPAPSPTVGVLTPSEIAVGAASSSLTRTLTFATGVLVVYLPFVSPCVTD